MEYIQVYTIEIPDEFDTAVARIRSSWLNDRRITITVEDKIEAEDE